MKHQFGTYDAGDGFTWFATKEEAQFDAMDRITSFRLEANDGWPDDVETVAVFEMIEEARFTPEDADYRVQDVEMFPTEERRSAAELEQELEETADKLSDVWLHLDSWARGEAQCLKFIQESAAMILRNQRAPGWKPEAETVP